MAKRNEPMEPEVLPPSSSMELAIEQGQAIAKMTNDQLAVLAKAEPRVAEVCLEVALKELDLMPELTAENYYSIPYKDYSSGKTTFVEGIGIHGSNNLARVYGNCAVSSGIVTEDGSHATVMGQFVDFEQKVVFRKERRVGRMRSRRQGPAIRLSEEKWFQLVAAEQSKAQRNATLDGLPSWLTRRYFDHCLKLAAGKAKDDAKVSGKKPWRELVAAFKKLGVEREAIEGLIGHTVTRLDDEELGRLRGIYNGLKSGDLSAASVFRQEPQKEPDANVDDVLKGGAETTAGAEAEDEAEEPQVTEEQARQRYATGCPMCERTWDIIDYSGHQKQCVFAK